MEEQILKIVKEVFKDYDFTSFALSEAKVICVNVYKKTNTLELKLQVTSSILIKELTDFEKYLSKRFDFRNIEIKLEYIEKEYEKKLDVDREILNGWNEITDYMAYKHPLTKALLKNSNVNIDGKNIIISFCWYSCLDYPLCIRSKRL